MTISMPTENQGVACFLSPIGGRSMLYQDDDPSRSHGPSLGSLWVTGAS